MSRPRSGAARWRTTVMIGLMGSIGALALPFGVIAAQGAVDGAAPGGDAVAFVHREVVAAGPYRIDVGFTEWPLRAERSLDILFEPERGIADKWGTLTLVAPSGDEEVLDLVRFPRQRTAWELDIIAVPTEGRWTARFVLDGPRGRGEGI